MAQTSFSTPNVRSFYNEVEQPILDFWKKNKIFEKSINQRDEKNRYIFYDGPPFVTGLPHYGHLLGSIIKDIVPRYQTMKGKRVERVWGWDCHGIPIEEKVERKHEIKSRREIVTKIGVKEFIDECYSYVNEVSGEWEWYIDRIARWVDMKNSYRTMDMPYMESVMWVVKQFHEKGMIYKGKRVSLYCTRCGTPLSNHEVAMDNSYKDLEDPSAFVKFELNYHKTGVGVGAIVENEKGEIMMIRRNEENRDKVYGIPGGKCEAEDKTVEETLRREIMEEVGCEVASYEYFGYAMDIFEGRLFKTHHFKVKLKGEPKVTDDSGLEKNIQWFPKNKIPWDDMHIPTRNGLKDILYSTTAEIGHDLSKEPNTEKPKVSIVAWTTTPWTLPANTALVVKKDADYVTCKVGDEYLIVAAELAEKVLKDMSFTIIDTYKGKELLGISYKPLFEYFKAGEKDYRIYDADFVSLEDGTGVVHMAPGFGEDDTNLGKAIGLSMHETIDDEGKFIPEVTDYAGIYFKKADEPITEELTKRGIMLKSGKITHSYPICYRCFTPLVYKAQDSWYVDIQSIKEKLHKNNQKINWVPSHLKDGRFANTISSMPDWGISRTRYWATPLPIWECNECDNLEVLGSIAEIEGKSGKKVTNLHRPYIDEHTYKCEKCNKGTMKRVEDVVDCWLESGSMPFAQYHYPFENKEKFEQNYPGDFVIEYVGQVRAWFNLMHVVSTILKDSPAFTNVITTGTVNGTDGRKMSKSLGNYPDPKMILEKNGGDAFRLYIAGSVLPIGLDLNVSEEAIAQPVKEVLLPLMNIYKYFSIYANQHGFDPTVCEICPHKAYCDEEMNVLDRWVLTRTKQAIISIDEALSSYIVPDAVAQLKPLIDDVSTWYIRRSRDRFVAGDKYALNTLFTVLVQMCKAFAPIIPFTTEYIYQELKKGSNNHIELESVHLEMFPTSAEFVEEETQLLDTMKVVREIVSLGQNLRVEKALPLKQPLSRVFYKGEAKLSEEFLQLIADEMNVQTVDEVEKMPTGSNIAVVEVGKMSVGLDTEINAELAEKGLLREVIRAIQSARKSASLEMGDKVAVEMFTKSKAVDEIVKKYEKEICDSCILTELKMTEEAISSETAIIAKIGQDKEELAIEIIK